MRSVVSTPLRITGIEAAVLVPAPDRNQQTGLGSLELYLSGKIRVNSNRKDPAHSVVRERVVGDEHANPSVARHPPFSIAVVTLKGKSGAIIPFP